MKSVKVKYSSSSLIRLKYYIFVLLKKHYPSPPGLIKGLKKGVVAKHEGSSGCTKR